MKRINYLFYPNEEDKVEHPTRTAKETKKKKEEKKKKGKKKDTHLLPQSTRSILTSNSSGC